MTSISPAKFLDFITYFRKDNPNHIEAMKAFAAQVDSALMDDAAPWVKQYRRAPVSPDPAAGAEADSLVSKQQLASIWICSPILIRDDRHHLSSQDPPLSQPDSARIGWWSLQELTRLRLGLRRQKRSWQ